MAKTIEELRAQFEPKPNSVLTPDENGLYDIKVSKEELGMIQEGREWTPERFAREYWDIKAETKTGISPSCNSDYAEVSFTCPDQGLFIKPRDDRPIEQSITRTGWADNTELVDGVTIGARGGGMEIPQLVWALRIAADKLQVLVDEG